MILSLGGGQGNETTDPSAHSDLKCRELGTRSAAPPQYPLSHLRFWPRRRTSVASWAGKFLRFCTRTGKAALIVSALPKSKCRERSRYASELRDRIAKFLKLFYLTVETVGTTISAYVAVSCSRCSRPDLICSGRSPGTR